MPSSLRETPNKCECECGKITPIETRNRFSRGRMKGQHSRFITGHNTRMFVRDDRHVVSDNGCWNWIGAKSERGYGRLGVDGKTLFAHRFYYEKYKGAIPHGLVIDHRCRNPSCVNPEHLDVVTQAENIRRGSSSRGDDGRYV